MSFIGANVKKFPLFMVFGVVLFLMALVTSFRYFYNNHEYIDCQRRNYNSRLNGGEKIFGGEKYTVNICGSGIDDGKFLSDGMDSTQLVILDASGEVLAKRNYKIFWDGRPGHEPLLIEPNKIIYQDDEEQKNYAINMPPTRWDWIMARLPF